jgi:transcription-repair coupling factor (superfamily II helicase)
MARSPTSGFNELHAIRELDAFTALARSLEAPGTSARASGLWGASTGLVLAGLSEATRRPVLVIAPTVDVADKIETDIATFLDREILTFPAYDVLPSETETPEMPVLSARLSTLARLTEPAELPPVAVAPVAAVLQPVPAPDALHRDELELRVGREIGYDVVVEWLYDRGLERVPAVGGRGEFAVRGGIIDIFPLYAETLVAEEGEDRASERPVRVEFDGDTIDTLRAFDPLTQRSLSDLPEYRVPGVEKARALDPFTLGEPSNVSEHLAESTIVVVFDPDEVERTAELYQASDDTPGRADWESLRGQLARTSVLELGRIAGEGDITFDTTTVQRVSGKGGEVASRLGDMASHLSALTVYCRDATEETRLLGILKRSKFEFPDYFQTKRGRLSSGFEIRDLHFAALADHEILGVSSEHRRVRQQLRGAPIADFVDLSAGDYVVHTTHGVGRYLGMTTLEKPGGSEDYLTLLFADNVKLYVPGGNAYLVERYIGAGDAKPALSKVGGSAWTRRKARAQKAVKDIAAELLRTQAERERTSGLAYPRDGEFQIEFEASFPFDETPDQLTASDAIKQDMERPVPMDRLLTGDVGFGKTEVAMRAAFKAVMAGRQVAMLVPTTLLAEQHAKTFAERFAGYPVTVESLSRFKTRREQTAVLKELEEGKVDIIIGTHRLLSKDVKFHDLGLLVVDEEQRFGVEDKEKLKKMRVSADILTLTATPIPRTLHMSLVGLRDICSLTIPPEERLSIRTKVVKFSPELVRRATLREIARGGQIYFVHDRVFDIDLVTGRLRALVPEARFSVAHGQMGEKELSQRMGLFLRHEVDVLVSTTIIESGLDIPTVNTIFINNADRFGLAELHQLRGRVGRYRHQAYAYLLVPEDRSVSVDAEKRLRAVEEFEELGAGFKLAMRDLEIRGAGNLLGAEQSGHIAEIGYELYCRLIERTVRELRGETVQDPVDVTLQIGWGANLGIGYIADEAVKLEMYRKVARTRKPSEVAAVEEELVDRFGPPPPHAMRVLAEARLRILAQRAQIPFVSREIEGERGKLLFKVRSPNFKRIEKQLKGMPGQLTVTGPEGFAVHLPAYLMNDDNVEETAARVLKRLA